MILEIIIKFKKSILFWLYLKIIGYHLIDNKYQIVTRIINIKKIYKER